MSVTLNPYLTFNGDAEAAMRFYEGVFGGELDLRPFSDFPQQDDAPAPPGIMHSQLTGPDGLTIMASDDPEGVVDAQGAGASISLSGDDEATLRGYWDQLSDGAHVIVPMETQMWGDTFGMCVDRFGVRWLVNIAGTPAT